MTTITVELEDEVAARLKRAADARGVDVSELLATVAGEISAPSPEFVTVARAVIDEYRPVLRRLGE